jgi:hypothetical protein
MDRTGRGLAESTILKSWGLSGKRKTSVKITSPENGAEVITTRSMCFDRR